jgi:hypothetical protein
MAKILMGDGKTVYFWKDNWIDGRSVTDIAPRVLSLVPTRRKNSRMVADALIEHKWIVDISDDMDLDAIRQCVGLWVAIRGMERDGNRPDQYVWKGVSRVSIPRGTPTLRFVRAALDSACIDLFGSPLLPPNARCSAGLRPSIDFGPRTEGHDMDFKTRQVPASYAYKRKILRSTSSCNAPTLGRCGTYAFAAVVY